MRCQIIAECASNHGGDLGLATRMIEAAARAGADYVKFQSYQVRFLSPADPQYAWLRQAELGAHGVKVLLAAATECGLKFMTTIFDREIVPVLLDLGVRAFKVGSGDSHRTELLDVAPKGCELFVSLPWGKGLPSAHPHGHTLATVPLYPMPLECYPFVAKQEGWSDHAVGLVAAQAAIVEGAHYVEKHFSLGGGQGGRVSVWDADEAALVELVEFARDVSILRTGNRYQSRWTGSVGRSSQGPPGASGAGGPSVPPPHP